MSGHETFVSSHHLSSLTVFQISLRGEFFVYHLGGKKRDSCLEKHLLWKIVTPPRLKLQTSIWSHFEDLAQTFKMGQIWGLYHHPFRSSTPPKLILLFGTVAYPSTKKVADP